MSDRPKSRQPKAGGPRSRPPGPRSAAATSRTGGNRRPGTSAGAGGTSGTSGTGARHGSGSAGPSRSPSSSGSPGSTGFRRTAERLSYPVILRLHRAPRWVVTIVLVALLVAGLLAPAPYGPVCLGVVVATMAWLTYLAWHEGDRSRRVIRLVALALGGAALAMRIVAA
ncbi:hypothetical protein SAMN05421678_10675 [Actinopolymorpha cephalotaxi]|uniref:Uncharacterized protein n=1 Tax=Actinopolymorpha cephalotaxi TaxID=504797 RepID=A0A1I2S1T8_9ACTN|nr:DUF6703 family protein [Actinopolymorpha cephalotaxi]NYH83871.1 hypothetical protein [Actinopolymorpha cephalotaxi]SFG46710.1 hypothetical protein SAMN05421678_10675 [Actinopolymorpha cephalotaxi]